MNNNNRTSSPPLVGYSTPSKGHIINNTSQARDDNEGGTPDSRHRFSYPIASSVGGGGSGVNVNNFGVNGGNTVANRENGKTNATAAATTAATPSKLRRRAHITSNIGGNSTHGKVGEVGSLFGSTTAGRTSDRSPVGAAPIIETRGAIIRQSSARAVMDVPDLEAAGSCGAVGDSEDSFEEETELVPGNRRHNNQFFSTSTKAESVPSRYYLAKPPNAAKPPAVSYAQVATEFSEPTRQRQRPTFRSRTTASASALNAAAAAAAAAPIETYPIYTNSHVNNLSPLSPSSPQPLSLQDDSRKWWKPIVGFFSNLRFWVFVQFLVIVTLATHVVVAEKKKTKIVEQLQVFEDEQANILTQMMWIDKAAKKITESNRIQPNSNSDLDSEYEGNLRQSILDLQNEIESIQSRIQDNARTYLANKYDGIKHKNTKKNIDNEDNISSNLLSSIRVMIHLQKEVNGLHDLKLDLWVDETPHAAWMWLEQVNQTMWDGGQFRWVSQGTLLATPKEPIPHTSLEFLENPRRQHNQDCEVSLMQNDRGMGFSLRINLLDDPPPTEHNVCIGRVLKGLENLQLPGSDQDLETRLPISFIKILSH